MTVRRLINWAIGLPVAVIVIAFCVANREWVRISFDPFRKDSPWATMDLPLWTLFFAGIFVGIIAGWVAAWINQGKWRRALRHTRADLQRNQDEIVRLRRETESRERLPAVNP